ncbi:MAG: hypothetical protein ACNI3C_11095 [Candidatus Marinarcus sp.]|uniref:hypothetical protein n=1 Tax=Candidatus Marinarcus sp. TaxID=3100987 RepID=UPI003B0041F2
MKKLVGIMSLLIIMILSGCSSSKYSLSDYQDANIAQDGVYKFNNPRIKESNLLVKITTYKDTKDGSLKKKIMMLNIDKQSNITDFQENDTGVIVWPFYNIIRNKVSTRIYEKGSFNELVQHHPYFISAGSNNGEVGFSYKLDFSEAEFIK